MAERIKVGTRSDLAPGKCRMVEVDGRVFALFNVDGTYYATENTCPHSGGPLGEGDLDGSVVTCPWHGWQFDVTTGECLIRGNVRIGAFDVRVEGDDLFVEV